MSQWAKEPEQAALLHGFSFKFLAWVPAQTSFVDELCSKSVGQINPFLPLIALNWSALSEKPDKTRTLCSCREVREQHAEVCSLFLGHGFQVSNLGCQAGSKHPYLQSQLVNLTCRTLKIFITAMNISPESKTEFKYRITVYAYIPIIWAWSLHMIKQKTNKKNFF